MEAPLFPILAHLFAAAFAGALIGLERTYHGRPAGFRTHALVCTASSLLMLLSTQQAVVLSGLPLESVRVDPARMAQGIMTGIGFLGAGVIMKEGVSVRGLTTAASIWITAAIGIMLGAGFYAVAVVATLLTLATLSLFRWLERVFPSLAFAQLTVRCTRAAMLNEDTLRALIRRHGIEPKQTTYRLTDAGKFMEFEMALQSRQPKNFRQLAEQLASVPQVVEYCVSLTGGK